MMNSSAGATYGLGEPVHHRVWLQPGAAVDRFFLAEGSHLQEALGWSIDIQSGALGPVFFRDVDE